MLIIAHCVPFTVPLVGKNTHGHIHFDVLNASSVSWIKPLQSPKKVKTGR